MFRWRVLLILAAGLLLDACSNRLVSAEPWFVAEAAGAPHLREGLWRTEDPKCKVDEAKPAEQWPVCANWFHVRSNRSFAPRWIGTGTDYAHNREVVGWTESAIVLAGGDPAILQADDCQTAEEEAAEPAEAADSMPSPTSEVVPGTQSPPKHLYCYYGLEVPPRGDRNEITAAAFWQVVCGPLPGKGADVTDQPWPGLRLAGKDCTADSEAALRNAARLSRTLFPGPSSLLPRIHWVRGGYH
ncbi:MAG: hypothetical protein WCL10_03520 [Novosphingobium sp.]|uniref:hypothetical protein n=1 Tax=Novosphingobium sp. TaxID=1874826 RepID=UPI0030190D72